MSFGIVHPYSKENDWLHACAPGDGKSLLIFTRIRTAEGICGALTVYDSLQQLTCTSLEKHSLASSQSSKAEAHTAVLKAAKGSSACSRAPSNAVNASCDETMA